MAPVASRSGFVAEFVEEVQSEGRLVFTSAELEARGKIGEALEAGLRRHAATGAIRRISPRSPIFVIVPPEYRTMGAPPVEWWLDDVMARLGQQYYLGLLSAAAAHGSSHFAVMQTQVVTTKWLRPITVGRTKVRFFQKDNVVGTPFETRQNLWSPLNVSAPEATVIDLLRLKPCGIAHTALILSDLTHAFRKGRLRGSLDASGETAAAQRLGWLLETLGNDSLAGVVENWLSSRRPQPVDLEAGGAVAWETSPRWKVKVNTGLEVVA